MTGKEKKLRKETAEIKEKIELLKSESREKEEELAKIR